MPQFLSSEKILAWIKHNFHDYRLRNGGKELVMPNPWGDSGHHFNVGLVLKTTKNGRAGFWVHDWRPGYQNHDGSFLKFVSSYRNISYHDAIKEVCGISVNIRDLIKEENKTEEPETSEMAMPPGASRISDKTNKLAHELAVNYLNSRAISADVADKYFIHYNSSSIIFPYIEFGVMAYWQSRSFIGKKFEFPNSNVGVTKSQFVYGFDYAEPEEDLIICESIIDSINIGPGAVAVGGATLSEKQVRKIRAINPSRIILGADNDEPDENGKAAGIDSIPKNYNVLKPYFKEIFFSIPSSPYKDWNDIAVAGKDVRNAVYSNMKQASIKTILGLKHANCC